ncbi:MAG TPA: outer membrane beta-barrel protein [Terracidiphilus sp.]|nr:outer membrane beta-barrel protein [Terracidiphilus sp.]
MKKIAFFAFLLAVSAAACGAQEARQDVSLSGTALVEPFMASSTDVQVSANRAFGGLVSYRFMITPNSALEANYGITYENTIHFLVSNINHYNVLTRTQEISGAYVRSFVFKNFNPFLEAGPAGFIFLPIRNSGTQTLDAKQQTEVGAIWGGGIAYEVSPSWDVRAEIRGMVTKVPDFGDSQINANRWYKISIYEPVIGVAYHF